MCYSVDFPLFLSMARKKTNSIPALFYFFCMRKMLGIRLRYSRDLIGLPVLSINKAIWLRRKSQLYSKVSL